MGWDAFCIHAQRTVRQHFQQCTVVTVAHRLGTILDADRVLVLDAGRIAELGAPAELLSTPGSVFGSMVAAAQSAGALTLPSGRC